MQPVFIGHLLGGLLEHVGDAARGLADAGHGVDIVGEAGDMLFQSVAQRIAASQGADGGLELALALASLHALGDGIQRL
ncbi:hypothetical protein D3C80_1685300 [compost metagenome]